MIHMIRKFKIKGLPSEKEFAGMPFGRSIDTLRAFEEFKTASKSVHISQKRQTYQKAIREAIKLYEATEYYCCFHDSPTYKDDSFEFFYR